MTSKKRLNALEARISDRSKGCILITNIGPDGVREVPTCPRGHVLSADHHECNDCEVPASKRQVLVFHHIPADWTRD